MASRQDGRSNTVLPTGAGAAAASGERKPSLSAGAAAQLKSLSAKLAGAGGGASSTFGGTLPDGSTSTNDSRRQNRKSVVLLSTGGQRRGSTFVGGFAAGDPTDDLGAGLGAAGDAMHPGLDRIKAFNRKKSVFRSGGGMGSIAVGKPSAVQFDDLATAMEVLDERIGGTLQQIRSCNAAGLGAVRGLAHTKSGRLRISGVSSIKEEVPADVELGGPAGDGEACIPRAPPVEAAAGRPERLLSRIRFHMSSEGSVHEDGSSSARARLESIPDGAPPPPGTLAPAGEPPATGAYAASGDSGSTSQVQEGAAQQTASPPARTRMPAVSWGASVVVPGQQAWARNLVQFGEYKQRQQLQQSGLPPPSPPPDGEAEAPGGAAAAPGMDTIGWLQAGAGLRSGGPGSNASVSSASAAAGGQLQLQGARGAPRSREEVALLQTWLQDMMAQVIAQAGMSQSELASSNDAASAFAASSADSASAASTMADAALWVYGMAFEELQRQVGTECTDRGALLGGMWQHVSNLVELRCSLVYEGIIGAITEELQVARRRAAASAAATKAAEARVQESMYYTRDKFSNMEAEVKSLGQLLATAEEEAERHVEEASLLRRSVDTQASRRVAAEARAAGEHRQRVDLEHRVEELEDTVSSQTEAASARDAELALLHTDLQHARSEGLLLAEEKARLEVEMQSAHRDYRTSEIVGLSLREQLATREAELSELSARHAALQQEQATATTALMETQASFSGLQLLHESLQTTAGDRIAKLEAALHAEQAALADVRTELGETQGERTSLQKSLAEAGARETAATAQLKQLAGAHEQQTSKLRQESDARRNADDELQAIRAGLQVTQQRLEGLGLVFASTTAHRTSAEAWRATGPISMGRQVVSAVNQQLGELAARKADLTHELGVAKERWQTEEAVRIRLQEQLLETKARESKLLKEKEGLEGVTARLHGQQTTLDAEVAQMRRMLADAEIRCQASHKKAMEAANEAKRLAPLEPQVARLQDALNAAHTELERVQREVTAHQTSIRKLLDEKSTALEQLSARNNALDAAQLQIRELTAASKDRLALAEAKAKLEEQLHDLHQRCSATERLQGESMHQLTVARRLLNDAASADDHAKFAAAQQELMSSKVTVAATRRESILLKDRLTATKDQLQFMERQLHVAVNSPLAAAMAAAAAASSAPLGTHGSVGGVSPAVVEQLRRLLDTKEERIRQLEKLHSSLTTSTSQLKALQSELGERDAQVAALQTEVETTRRRLHSLQDAQAKTATKSLVALAASDPSLPPEIAQALALDYARKHLRSELAWTKAKLVVVAHMASGLRTKLQAAELTRAQAEMESVCVESFYLEQGLMDHRAFSATFDATFIQVKRALTSTLGSLVELRRQLVAPAAGNLPRIADQMNALAAALGTWVHRFQGRKDEACHADPVAELAAWQHSILDSLPASRPTSPPSLQHVSAIIVQLYAHRVRQLPLAGPSESSAMMDSVYEAAVEFFCERRGFTREAALSPTGPVAALLAGVRSHVQQPKQLLLGRLAGLVPSGGSGNSRSLQHPAAWQFFVRLLCCVRVLQGAGWEALVKEWVESETGVQVALPTVMNVLANLHNTDAPALLDSMRRGLVPLVRQGRRGPAIDLDAFLLVCMNDYCDGNCPVSPLAQPRRLTDGALSSGALAGSSNYTCMTALAGTVSGVAASLETYRGGGLYDATAGQLSQQQQQQHQQQQQQQQQQQRNPMRKRIVNLTAAADSLPMVGGHAGPPRSAAASPEPVSSSVQQQGLPGIGGSPLAASAAGFGAAAAAAAAAGGAGASVGSRSPQVLSGMQTLMSSNPELAWGLRSGLRASAPNAPPSAATGDK